MKLPKLQNTIERNKWLLVVALFFLVWKFFLIHTMWNNRSLPPEPRDSFIYISHISSVIHCPSLIFCDGIYSLKKFAGYEHLTYRLFFGTIGKIFNWTAIQTYHYSFYIGTLLLIPTLVYFIKKLTNNKTLQIFILFSLALYNGIGSFHGFFWVVPTFFSFILFLIIFGILFDNNPTKKYWLYLLPILTLMASLNHLISIYSSVIFFIYFTLDCFIHKQIDWLYFKKLSLIMLFSLISYIYPIITTTNHSLQVTNLLQETEILSETTHKINFSATTSTSETFLPGLNYVIADYVHWVFPNILGLLLFILIIAILIYYRKTKIIILYLSALIFTIISSISVYGVRSLLFLWPITFVLYAYGFYYGFILVKSLHFKKSTIMVLNLINIIIMLSFIMINVSYSYLVNQEYNMNIRLNIPNKFKTYLINSSPTKINCSTTIIRMYPTNNYPKNYCASPLSKATIFITYSEKINPSLLQILMAKYNGEKNLSNIIKTHDEIPSNFYLAKKLGDILIYKKK